MRWGSCLTKAKQAWQNPTYHFTFSFYHIFVNFSTVVFFMRLDKPDRFSSQHYCGGYFVSLCRPTTSLKIRNRSKCVTAIWRHLAPYCSLKSRMITGFLLLLPPYFRGEQGFYIAYLQNGLLPSTCTLYALFPVCFQSCK